ncbi:MAG: transcription/translation regulatory transformer protein RfaH [Gammaproteobacteria bacterium]|nr:transcription/translation regulatory transformer protein RfaH [Gammaproteobacteria bacterium]
MSDVASRAWYLLYAKPHQEAVAQVNLARQGYETYLPLIHQTRKRQGRRIVTVGPMFPRYLFIHLDNESDNWGPIRSTLGVASLVRFGQQAAQVPTDLVAALRQREDGDGIHALPVEQHRPGSRIRITEGSLAGYEGIFLAKSGRDRVVLLLEILGKKTRTVIGVDTIESS